MSAHASEGCHFRDYIDSFDLWNPLTNTQRNALISHTHFMHAAKGRAVYRGALADAGILHIISGSLRVYILSEEGREFTLYILRDGDIGLMSRNSTK